jgi:hypothetical protein
MYSVGDSEANFSGARNSGAGSTTSFGTRSGYQIGPSTMFNEFNAGACAIVSQDFASFHSTVSNDKMVW